MKVIIVALALVAAAAAAAVDNVPQTLRAEVNQNPDGSYNYAFESDDGITRQEIGELKQIPNEEGKLQTVVVVKGSYAYTDKEGNAEQVNYYADDTGFHADGPSIPKPVSRR